MLFDQTQEFTDCQIVGNGLELGSSPGGGRSATSSISYRARGQGMSIIGNTIESHLYDGGHLIKMEASATHTVVEMRIVGNKIARQNGAMNSATGRATSAGNGAI